MNSKWEIGDILYFRELNTNYRVDYCGVIGDRKIDREILWFINFDDSSKGWFYESTLIATGVKHIRIDEFLS